MQESGRFRGLIAAGVLLGLSGAAMAQWVMVARHAVGRIEQMQQSAPAGGASYDVATVIVEVDPGKVFDTIKRMVGNNTQVKVTRTDDARRSVEFTDGKQIAGIQVNALGEKLSQLMVSSAHPGVASSTTSTIVERILSVCKELNVACQRAAS